MKRISLLFFVFLFAAGRSSAQIDLTNISLDKIFGNTERGKGVCAKIFFG